MITVGAVLRAATATVQPPRRGERADDMFVGAPGQYLRELFDLRGGVI
jgi:hypothetical protein